MSQTYEKLKDLEINLKIELEELVKSSKGLTSPEQIRKNFNTMYDKYLGKSGEVGAIIKDLASIKDIEEKKKVGIAFNNIKKTIEEKLNKTQSELISKILSANLQTEKIDPTHPGIKPKTSGRAHILSQTIERIEDIFLSMGFDVEYPYEVDNEYNTFDALNIPASHPSRDSWDTLWLDDGNLTIPHTSAMQNRILKAGDIPIRKVIIGKCFRNEATDGSHEHTFTQLEGVYLDKSANMSEMVGVLVGFFEAFFEQKLDYKFTPDYFPFVEPGGQLAIKFTKNAKTDSNDKDDKTKIDLKSNFLEVLGCGMIHPEVLKQAGKDPDIVSGFAWGLGVERIAMIKHNIKEIRYMHGSELKFNRQFA